MSFITKPVYPKFWRFCKYLGQAKSVRLWEIDAPKADPPFSPSLGMEAPHDFAEAFRNALLADEKAENLRLRKPWQVEFIYSDEQYETFRLFNPTYEQEVYEAIQTRYHYTPVMEPRKIEADFVVLVDIVKEINRELRKKQKRWSWKWIIPKKN